MRVGPSAIVKRPFPDLVGLVPVHSHANVPVLCGVQRVPTTFYSQMSSTSAAGSDKFAGVIFSANQPADLPQRLPNLSEWTLSSSKKGISRQFIFPGFASAWRFMSAVADECKSKRHHPSWHNLYNKVTVEWTTHNPEGLSIKDVEMAEFCDRIADEIGLKKSTGT